MLTVKLDRQALSRYGINVADVQNLVEIAVGGKSAGRVFEGDRRFDIVVRLPEHLRSDIEAIKSLPIPLPPVENAGQGDARAVGQFAARPDPLCAAVGARRRSISRPAPTRSAARTASGGSW